MKHTRKFTNNDLLDMLTRTEPFEVIGTSINTCYSVIVDEEFDSVRQFENIVRVLDGAQEGDLVEIKLSTNGGALHAILPLLAAMENTRAGVAVHAISDVASAGTLILLQADDVYVNPYATIFFHQVQFGSQGQGSSVEAHVTHTMKSSKALLHDMYKDFFTEAEIEAMLSGKDFYMGKEEFDERYATRFKIREAAMLAGQEVKNSASPEGIQKMLDDCQHDWDMLEEGVVKKPAKKKRRVKATPVIVPEE